MFLKKAFCFFLISALFSCSEGINESILLSRTAYVNVDTGILRTDPMPMAPELDLVPYGTRVQIVKKSNETMRIGSIKQHWYLVRLDNKIEGWIYGNSITFNASSIDSKKGPASKDFITISEEDLKGKWWEINDGGKIGLGKIYFFPEGIYRYGYGQSEMFEGSYEISDGYVLLDRGSSGGDRLEVTRVGQEIRLKGTKKSIVYTFVRSDEDPGSLDEKENELNKTGKVEKSETRDP